MFRYVIFIVLLVSGCAAKHEFVTTCKGPLVVLNTEKWQPTATDMTLFESRCPEGR